MGQSNRESRTHSLSQDPGLQPIHSLPEQGRIGPGVGGGAKPLFRGQMVQLQRGSGRHWQAIDHKGCSLFSSMDTPSVNGKIQSVFRLSRGSSWKPYLFLFQPDHLPIFTFFFYAEVETGGTKKLPNWTSLLRGDIKGGEGSFKWGSVHFIFPFKLAAINFQFYAGSLQLTKNKGKM